MAASRLMALYADLSGHWPSERVDVVRDVLKHRLAGREIVEEALDELAGDEWEMLQMALDRGLVSGDWRRALVRRRICRLQDLEACALEGGEEADLT